MLDNGMGAHPAFINLPEGSQGFSEFTIDPILGVAQDDELDPSRIFYHEGLTDSTRLSSPTSMARRSLTL